MVAGFIPCRSDAHVAGCDRCLSCLTPEWQTTFQPASFNVTMPKELFAFDPSLLHFTGFVMPEIDATLAGHDLDESIDEENAALATSTMFRRSSGRLVGWAVDTLNLSSVRL